MTEPPAGGGGDDVLFELLAPELLELSVSAISTFVKPVNKSVKQFEHRKSLATWMGGRDSSLVVCQTRCPAWCSILGSILLWGDIFSGRGDFSCGVNMGSDSIPLKTLLDESKNHILVCAHMHSIARAQLSQKILTFMS